MIKYVRLDAMADSSGDFEGHDVIADKSAVDPATAAEESARRLAVAVAIGLLPLRTRLVLRCRLLDLSDAEIATIVGLSREHVRQIEAEAIVELRGRLAHWVEG